MKKKALFVLAVSLVFSLLVGCASPRAQYGKREVNILGGLVKGEQGSYERLGPLTIGMEVEEITARPDLDGDRISFLWGMFTIADH